MDIIKGYYSVTKATPLRYRKPPDKTDRLETWKLEEKQTDVNIALDLYRDVLKAHCQQIVVCTNDTDIVPALNYIKQDFPEVTIGIVFPLRPTDENRTLPKALSDLADWKRAYISDSELASAQFPQRVSTRKKPVDKPDYQKRGR